MIISQLRNQPIAQGLPKPTAAAPTETPQDSVQLGQAAEDNKDLRAAFDRLVNVGGPGKAQLLEDNIDAWNARWRMMESAKDTINCQYFCWDHDVFGMALMGFMYKKAQENVDIRLMVDATGDTFGTRGFKSHIGGKDYLQELVGTGKVEAKVYHPHWKKVIDQVLNIGSSAIAASNHDKILEVDGERGITGGRNIGYEYFVHPQDFKGAWRDTDIAFEGRETADALRSAFDVEYGAPWITSRVGADVFGNFVRRDLELLGAYAMMDSWLKQPPLNASRREELRSNEESRTEAAEALLEAALERLPAEGATREPNAWDKKNLRKLAQELVKYPELQGTYNRPQQPVHDGEVKILDKTSSVGVGTDRINVALLDLARSAKQRIVIENPYVVLTDSLIDGLKEAGEKGVEIWLGTNSPSSTDSAVTQAFFLQDWPKLEATIPNLKIFTATGDRKLHAKVAVIDDTVSLVSTFNLDWLSQQVNSEVASVVWSKSFAKQTMSGIERDHLDPNNGVVEYTIKRDESGQPIRSDGLPVLGEDGELLNNPEVTFGPENHLTTEQLDAYKTKIGRWSFLRKFLPQLESLETLKVKNRES
jgi:cardiolipin synthase C